MTQRLELEPDDRRESRPPPTPHWQGLRAILLGVVVTVLAGGSWWAGHSSSKATIDSVVPIPEIHPDTAPVKEVPANPGGMVVPDQDSTLLNREAKPKTEELLPPPEAVKPRPVAPVPASASPPPSSPLPSLPSAPSQLAAATPPAARQASPPLPPPVPVPARPQAAAVPAPPPAAPAKSTPNPVIVPGSGYRLQLGALRSEEAAKAEFVRLQKAQPALLGRLSLSISKIDLGSGKGVYYRIQAGPIASEAQAIEGCATLKSRNVGCILVKP